MIARLLCVTLLCLSIVPAAADDPAEANRLLVEAVKLMQAAEQDQKANHKLAKLESALAKLNQIMDNHPSSDLAVRLITHQEIGILSLPKLIDAIRKTKDESAGQLAEEIIFAASAQPDVVRELDGIADPEFRQDVIVSLSQMLSPRFPHEHRLFFAGLIEDLSTRDDHLLSIARDRIFEFNDYDSALAVADLMQSLGRRDSLLMEIARHYTFEGDLKGALTLAKRINYDTNRDEVLTTIVDKQIDQNDFEGALSTAELIQADGSRNVAVGRIKNESHRHNVLNRE